jgi:hypothetical protein
LQICGGGGGGERNSEKYYFKYPAKVSEEELQDFVDT